MAGRAFNPADSGAVVAEQGHSFFRESATDMFHHEPQDDKSRQLEVGVGQ